MPICGPVKLTAFNGSAFTRALPISPPDPAMKFTTPFGMPASWQASTMRHDDSGDTGDGLTADVATWQNAGWRVYALGRRIPEPIAS